MFYIKRFKIQSDNPSPDCSGNPFAFLKKRKIAAESRFPAPNPNSTDVYFN